MKIKLANASGKGDAFRETHVMGHKETYIFSALPRILNQFYHINCHLSLSMISEQNQYFCPSPVT